MRRLLVGMVAIAVAGGALAAGPGAVRKRVEASMLLTGSITVAPDGSVSAYEIDKADNTDALPAGALFLVNDGLRLKTSLDKS